jgi:hypothetical protein
VGAEHSVVRVKGSAGPLKGKLEVTTAGAQDTPVSVAVTILVLVTSAVMVAFTIGVIGWLADTSALPLDVIAFGALAIVLGAGMLLAFRRLAVVAVGAVFRTGLLSPSSHWACRTPGQSRL